MATDDRNREEISAADDKVCLPVTHDDTHVAPLCANEDASGIDLLAGGLARALRVRDLLMMIAAQHEDDPSGDGYTALANQLEEAMQLCNVAMHRFVRDTPCATA